VFETAALLSGLPAIGLGWLEGNGPHDLDSIASRVSNAIADLPSVILVGHSLGTSIAMLVALQQLQSGSTRIKGLVLSNSGANTRGHGDIAKLVEWIGHDWGRHFGARLLRVAFERCRLHRCWSKCVHIHSG
jgi:pimeloyl-ACP methyl ester carboxylesterase